MRAQVSEQLLPADSESDQEQSQHLEETVAEDKLPHPLHGSLMEELKHAFITRDVGKPSPEISLRDAVQGTYSPLLRLKRIRQRGPENSLADNRKGEEYARRDKYPFGGQAFEQRQQHAHSGI